MKERNIMSFSSGIVRVEETLSIKISEIRNLLPRVQGSPKLRSPFCTVNLDQETVFTTPVVKNSLSPYFGEEFQFEIPRQFRYLNVYVYDKNDPSPNGIINGAIGKVAISKQDLCKLNGKDHWFPVVPIDADSEVKGKVHLEVFRVNKSLAIRVKECGDLTIVKNTCDPFAVVCVDHPISLSGQKGKISRNAGSALLSFQTRTWKKTANPRFDETFYFPDDEIDYSSAEIRVSVWHDSGSVWGDVFLGEIRIPLQSLDKYPKYMAWYFLQPRDHWKGHTVDKGASVRLGIRYSSDHIISSECYDPLRHLLLESLSVDTITSSAVYVLGEICDDKLDVAKPIVRIFLHHGKLTDLIRSLAGLEMDAISDVSTLFRGNTLLSKCVDELMKLVGRYYLQTVLKQHIDKIYAEQKNCEIDTSRMSDANDLSVNLRNLTVYISQILDAITESALSCPVLISDILAELKLSAITKYPQRPEIQYSVIGGFIMLRFFAPAILGPKLFDLRSEAGFPPYVARTLTLISKAIQSVGNCLSNESNKVLYKEPYMAQILDKFCAEPYLQKMRVFLDTVASTNIIHSSFPVKLKDGYLTKRAQGRKRFGWKNFKKRYFALSTHELYYSKGSANGPLCKIPVGDILAAECVNEDSFNMKNMFQVIQPHRQLYIQAANCVDAKEWLDALNFVVHRNQRKRDLFHPGVYVSGMWQCCKKVDHSEIGCCNVTPLHHIPFDIDVDRELEKIHSLFLKYIDRLDKIHANCQTDFIFIEKTHQHHHENSISRLNAINEIRNCVISLEQEHKHHIKQMYQKDVYGSEFAPIGEENYLLLSESTTTTATVDAAHLRAKNPLEITRC